MFGQPDRSSRTRKGQAACTTPVGKFRNSTAATFTMVHCADTNEQARAEADESFVWYPQTAATRIAELADWMTGEDLGNYAYVGEAQKTRALLESAKA